MAPTSLGEHIFLIAET